MLFSNELTPALWGGSSVANQGGFQLGISAAGITNAGSGPGVSAREASTKFVEDNLTWLKGAHSITSGFNYTAVDVWLLTQTRVPSVNFGIVTGDPALDEGLWRLRMRTLVRRADGWQWNESGR